jgi:replication-associated recombination protein RarA
VIHDPKKVDRVLSLREKWVLLSQKEGIRSEAMEKLLKLTGLKRVKEFALNLFQTAISLAKMSPEDRKANPWSKNMVFMGNPGTGKTVVAGFIAQILFDSGIRKSKEIVKTTAQALKDGGTAGFKTLIDKARNGCLFIDEAYDLDPMADFKGKPICADLLTTAEDERESLTIILAGYQDDIEKKLFAYNPGFPSRFENVYFEDFDQEDLEEICLGMLKSRNISYDPQVPKLLAQRLSLKANTKGFGNARDVRKDLDRAIEKSLSLPDFNGKARVDLIDIAGEDPSRNKKLQLLVEDLNQKIGWDPIKKAIAELISQSTKNYERQLKGQPPLPVFLNRLFLGNPGTGKTTCAEIYGKILKELKLLSQGNLVKKTAGDFIGEHIGSSQTKTKTILDSAKGNILVIDEAYNLDDSMFGKQVLDVLVEKVQGTIADDIAVILLGYEKPMLDMIRNQNPGLSRRFPKEFAFDFEDYNDDQLLQILIAECKKKEIQVASYEVYERIIQVISRQRSGPNFGNVGSLNLLLQNCVVKASVRNESHIKICLEDIETGIDRSKDPLEPLKNLFKIDNILSQIVQLRDAFAVATTEGDELPNPGHFVFRGSPGTGKTTVARVIAEVLFNLEIIASKKIVERSGLDLCAEYVVRLL